MSVTVTIVLQNMAGETIQVINNCLTQIDKCINIEENNIKNLSLTESKKHKNFIDFLYKQRCLLLEEIDKLNKYEGLEVDNESKTYLKIQKDIDSLAKRIINLISNKNIVNFFEEQEEIEQKQIQEKIQETIREYGVMAFEAIRNLEENGKAITEENILNEIEDIRYNKIQDEKLVEYKNELLNYIDSLEFESSKLRFELKSYVSQFSSPQELTDCFAYVNSKKSEIIKIDSLAKSIFERLSTEEHFEIIGEATIERDIDGIVRKTYKLKNNMNNVIDITIDGQLNIRFQLGNYQGHACEQTAEKIFDAIKKAKYQILSKKSSRNISNQVRYAYIKGDK